MGTYETLKLFKFDEFVKSQNLIFSVIPASDFNKFWTQVGDSVSAGDQVRHDDSMTFYENIRLKIIRRENDAGMTQAPSPDFRLKLEHLSELCRHNDPFRQRFAFGSGDLALGGSLLPGTMLLL
ncbi:MAG: hypothetical protein C4530_09345 [Desulfobacteraceae bacterium]|nr:MAG: hypothetical protein C4530_09345 [Desulfobacteraceae bacterium]